MYEPRVCVLVQILKLKLLKVINKVLRESGFPSIPIIKESYGDWGLLIQEGRLVDMGAYWVENKILEHVCCGCIFEGIFLFLFLYIGARFFP